MTKYVEGHVEWYVVDTSWTNFVAHQMAKCGATWCKVHVVDSEQD